jgi:hypothetical protein
MGPDPRYRGPTYTILSSTVPCHSYKSRRILRGAPVTNRSLCAHLSLLWRSRPASVSAIPRALTGAGGATTGGCALIPPIAIAGDGRLYCWAGAPLSFMLTSSILSHHGPPDHTTLKVAERHIVAATDDNNSRAFPCVPAISAHPTTITWVA